MRAYAGELLRCEVLASTHLKIKSALKLRFAYGITFTSDVDAFVKASDEG